MMKFVALAALVGFTSAAAPVIELNLPGVSVRHARLVRSHNLGYTQPDGALVQSHQDWTERCEATHGKTDCRAPEAHAYDHADGRAVAITTRLYQLACTPAQHVANTCKTADKLLCVSSKNTKCTLSNVNFSQRQTVLFKYDAHDKAGNRATQVVWGLTIEDLVAPTITIAPANKAMNVEAGVQWSLPTGVIAQDNIDTTVAMTKALTVSVKQISPVAKTVITGASEAAASAATSKLAFQQGKHDYVVTYTACDTAGVYGKGGKSNCVTTYAAFKVRDTQRPSLTLTAANPTYSECAIKYVDSGASVADVNDVKNRQPGFKRIAIVSKSNVNAKKVGNYEVDYNAKDFAGNAAKSISRAVKVRDTTAPKIALKSGLVHGIQCSNLCILKPRNLAKDAGVIADPGLTATDTCSATTETRKWNRPMSTTGKHLGDYIRTYSVRDASNNVAHITRTFRIVDDEAPVLTLVGKDIETYEATRDGEYTDKGATCNDFVHGLLSHAVTSQGANVNLRLPGTYKIKFTCSDISGLVASPIIRTVIVRSTQCPTIAILGKNSLTIEAGFPYTDAGATATDNLDGDLTKKITTSGNVVDTSGLYQHARSCAEVKKADSKALTGKYIITTWADGAARKTYKRTAVWCDFEKSATHTFLLVLKGQRVGYNHRGSCKDYGMMKVVTQYDAKSGRYSLPYSNGAVAISEEFGKYRHMIVDRHGTSDTYLCTKPMGVHVAISTSASATPAAGAEVGTYIIAYHVKDRYGNMECQTKYRTVVVKDTLAPVIALKMGSKVIHVSDASKKGLGGETNPATLPKENAFLSSLQAGNMQYGYMAEQAQSSSSSAWIMAAAASAVTGLALLGYATRKSTVTTVPV